jgi:hypothetical protein
VMLFNSLGKNVILRSFRTVLSKHSRFFLERLIYLRLYLGDRTLRYNALPVFFKARGCSRSRFSRVLNSVTFLKLTVIPQIRSAPVRSCRLRILPSASSIFLIGWYLSLVTRCLPSNFA